MYITYDVKFLNIAILLQIFVKFSNMSGNSFSYDQVSPAESLKQNTDVHNKKSDRFTKLLPEVHDSCICLEGYTFPYLCKANASTLANKKNLFELIGTIQTGDFYSVYLSN